MITLPRYTGCMDPDETLKRIRFIASIFNDWFDSDNMEWESVAIAGSELADLFIALDEWLSSGGFPPQAWRDAGHTPVS